MNYLIDIGHPGHVHLFRNAYFALLKRGHTITVTVREIPIAKRLLDYYNIPYINLGAKKDSLLGKAISVIKQDFEVFSIIKKNSIELGMSSGIVLSHVALFTKIRTLMFDDDDDLFEPLVTKFGHPFSDSVITPDTIKRKTKKNLGYKGTHELAYLHPNQFKPDSAVIKKIGLSEDETFFVLRFVAMKGHHDFGHSGISFDQKKQLVSFLSSKGKVFITSERPIEPEFEEFRLPVPPEEIHSLLYYATMFLGDSQTMTSEAAILGTPSLKCNTFAGKLSVPNELEEKYGLCFSYQPVDFENFLSKAKELIEMPGLKSEWAERRHKFLADKIDVTAFMVWFIENYPESVKIMKKDPSFQHRFKP